MVVISMNTQREAARRAKKGIANAIAQDNQVPQPKKVAMKNQVPVAPPPMADRDIRATFL